MCENTKDFAFIVIYIKTDRYENNLPNTYRSKTGANRD